MFKQSPKRHIPKQNLHASPNCKHTGSLAISRPHDSIYQCQIPKKEKKNHPNQFADRVMTYTKHISVSLFDKQRCWAGLRPHHCSQLSLMSAANCPADGGLPFIMPILCLCPSSSSLHSLAIWWRREHVVSRAHHECQRKSECVHHSLGMLAAWRRLKAFLLC